MSRQTVLDITQTVLSSLDSDNVNSISDTEESLQVASIVKDVYFDFIQRIGFPEHKALFELEPSGDPVKPTLMYRPSNVINLELIRYNKRLNETDAVLMQEVFFLPLPDFLDQMYGMTSTDPEAVSFEHIVAGNSLTILGKNNAHPTYWSSFDDETIIFDSYLADLDTTLQKTKTLCWGTVEPDFDLIDNFTPDLDSQHFPTFIQEVKEQAFAELKQMPNNLAARKARRGNITLQKNKRALPKEVNELDRLPHYGRKW